MTKSRWFVAALALSLAATGCGDDDETTAGTGSNATVADRTTTTDGSTTTADGGGGGNCAGSIGVMGPFTGDAASIGQEQLNWAKFAVDRYNDENDTNFELVEGDTQLDPAQASTVAQQFASNEAILAVVGPAGSQEVEAIGPVYARENLAMVSPSATKTSLTEGGQYPTFFRVVPNDDTQGPAVAKHMLEELDADNVLIVDDQTSYSTGLAESVAKALQEGDAEVSRQSVSQDQTDFSALVSAVGDDVDVVFLPWQIAANGKLFAQQLEEQGEDATVFGSDGLFSPTDFDVDGALVSSFAPDVRGVESSKDVVQDYVEAYDDEFGTFGPPTYAAANVAMEAISAACEDGAPTREAVLEQVRDTDLSESVLGFPIRFDDNGDVEGAEFYIFEIDGGEYRLAGEG